MRTGTKKTVIGLVPLSLLSVLQLSLTERVTRLLYWVPRTGW